MPEIPEADVQKCAQVLVLASISKEDVYKEIVFTNFIIAGKNYGNFKVTIEEIVD